MRKYGSRGGDLSQRITVPRKSKKAETMESEASKALVRRYLELWGTSNPVLAKEILAVDFVDHTHPDQEPGPEAVTREATSFREAFPDVPIPFAQLPSQTTLVPF